MARSRPSPTASSDGASASAALAAILERAGPEAVQLLELVERRLMEIASAADLPQGGGSLGVNASQTLAAGGKRLRPLLVLLCAREATDRTREDLVRAACAVELVHMAALLHDDVLDRAAIRRGRPTVYAGAGREAAVAVGDFLFARAFAELARARDQAALRTLSEAASALVRGELMQRADAWSTDVQPERYLQRCELKTASLFGAACALGALLTGRGERAAQRLEAFGRSIGLAFQILDDVLDVAGSPEETGKRIGTDLLDGTVTLPLILARESDAALTSVDLRALEPGAATEALCARIAATGALERSRAIALGHVEAAKTQLAESGVEDERAVALELVAEGVADRRA